MLTADRRKRRSPCRLRRGLQAPAPHKTKNHPLGRSLVHAQPLTAQPLCLARPGTQLLS